jgi:hypothetical protein
MRKFDDRYRPKVDIRSFQDDMNERLAQSTLPAGRCWPAREGLDPNGVCPQTWHRLTIRPIDPVAIHVPRRIQENRILADGNFRSNLPVLFGALDGSYDLPLSVTEPVTLKPESLAS